ncbi:hypothetical protein CSOJ01_15376 [Colletotrichum sojae]|uniref:Uncharacterized protein n=1 Tax=Colletotrichum sojae TaxID=2175907 RepID=A0A8H6IN18_9PEZI|nr:hypothetical protein CSOJ01_15376 [Colletotrichum sojae]
MSATESHTDFQLFTHAVKVGSDTLKLDRASGHLCPLTKETAAMLKDWGTKGLKAVSGDGAVSLSECRMMVTIHEYDLAACFRDQSKYADLIADLRRIFREHYILRETSATQVVTRPVLERAPSTSTKPPSPVTRGYRKLAELFCQDFFLIEVVDNLLRVLRDHLHGDRDDDQFKMYIWHGNWNTLAQDMRSDWRFLETRLHRPQDQKLKEAFGKAMIDMDRKTFSVHREMFPSVRGVSPTEEAEQTAAIFLPLWEALDARYGDFDDDFEDDYFYDWDESVEDIDRFIGRPCVPSVE